MPEICPPITPDELRQFDLFKDDEPAALEWLAERFVVRCYEAGEEFVKPGDPATEFIVVLEGELHFLRDSDLYGGAFIRLPGQPTGVLPFSRMTTIRGRGLPLLEHHATLTALQPVLGPQRRRLSA